MESILNDLLPPTVDVVIPQGSDVKEFFTIWTDTAKTTPLDLTGLTAECMVRKTYDTRTAAFTLSSADATIWLGARLQDGLVVADDPANGGICVFYPSELTTSVRFSGEEIELVRDIELTDQTGNKKRILQGVITLSRESTR